MNLSYGMSRGVSDIDRWLLVISDFEIGVKAFLWQCIGVQSDDVLEALICGAAGTELEGARDLALVDTIEQMTIVD